MLGSTHSLTQRCCNSTDLPISSGPGAADFSASMHQVSCAGGFLRAADPSQMLGEGRSLKPHMHDVILVFCLTFFTD